RRAERQGSRSIVRSSKESLVVSLSAVRLACTSTNSSPPCHSLVNSWTSNGSTSIMRPVIASLFMALAVTVTAQRAGVTESPANAKLTKVLIDLVQQTGSLTTLSADTLPESVRDAIQSRRLRFDANNQVQVYILLGAVDDNSIQQLTDLGVTIEIRDAARRRVQAHLPVARLQAVAQLAVVDAIRLPTYGRRRAGSVTTEGDRILSTDAVRQQLGLDGTGVRVGVVSDGLK